MTHDTKLGGEVDSRVGGDLIQESIDTCIDWHFINSATEGEGPSCFNPFMSVCFCLCAG